MMKLLTGMLLTLGLGFSLAASASTLTDGRGFSSCENELLRTLGESGLVLKHDFEVADRATTKTFYIKGSAWADDGSRTGVSSTCVTDRFGHGVISLDTKSAKSISRGGIVAVR